ncbi:hypothetical protein VNO77_12068 [Canavalia gladiata]|uniref:Uncharacterized protein n=1 Tax=Canavalia gladiata TaxID=3824 RepID=A0AAN9LWF6_CANGL
MHGRNCNLFLKSLFWERKLAVNYTRSLKDTCFFPSFSPLYLCYLSSRPKKRKSLQGRAPASLFPVEEIDLKMQCCSLPQCQEGLANKQGKECE